MKILYLQFITCDLPFLTHSHGRGLDVFAYLSRRIERHFSRCFTIQSDDINLCLYLKDGESSATNKDGGSSATNSHDVASHVEET